MIQFLKLNRTSDHSVGRRCFIYEALSALAGGTTSGVTGPKPIGADICTMNSSVLTKSLEMASSKLESSSIAPSLILFSKSGSHPKHPAPTPLTLSICALVSKLLYTL